jgi:penicillin-binding protein A
VEAWEARDFRTMAGRIAGIATTDLERRIERQLEVGQIESFDVQIEGEVDQPAEDEFDRGGEPVVDVPYAISYESSAMSEAAVLSGDLPMKYSAQERSWSVDWSKSSLWPGIDGAARFEVSTRWPKRAPILDRHGHKLAVGAAEGRRYPFRSVGGSVVGHIGMVTKENAAEHDIGEPGDLVGGSGFEAAFEERLAGTPAASLAVVDARGRKLTVLGRIAAVRGRALRTTFNAELQRAAESAFGETLGGVAVIDPRTGDLLAAVGSGAFDPSNYIGAAEVSPFNRALEGLYPPGSAMKVVTAAAALEEDVVTPETTVTGPKEYKGVRNFESGEFGSIPFATAVKYSVNTAFAQVAEKLGARRLTRYAEAFGFNTDAPDGVEIATSSFPFPEGLGDLMWASIGQAQVLATPVQMASVAATVANDGRRMDLRIDKASAPSGERVASRATAAQVTNLMESVVEGGTGSAARVGGLRIAGKTGTAEVDVNGKRMNHAWFIAFAPVEDPRVAVAVVSELGGVGGEVAAPLARQVLINVLPHTE